MSCLLPQSPQILAMIQDSDSRCLCLWKSARKGTELHLVKQPEQPVTAEVLADLSNCHTHLKRRSWRLPDISLELYELDQVLVSACKPHILLGVDLEQLHVKVQGGLWINARRWWQLAQPVAVCIVWLDLQQAALALCHVCRQQCVTALSKGGRAAQLDLAGSRKR